MIIFKPYLNKQKILKNIKNCLDSTYVATAGKFIKIFEKKIAKYTASKFVNLTNSGSSALHAIFLSLGVKKGDTVIIPSYNFIASTNATYLCGAKIWYVDISRKNLCMDMDKLELILKDKTYFDSNGKTRLKKDSSLIKLVCPTTAHGSFPDLKKLNNLKKKYKFLVVLDSAGSLGCEYDNKKLGQLNCDASILSFNGNKLMTSSAGGAVLTSSKKLHDKVNLLIANGRKNINYEIFSIGFNYRMTNIQAAIGCAQMDDLKNILKEKKRIYEYYLNNIKNSKVTLKLNVDCTKKNFWFPYLEMSTKNKSMELLKLLQSNNIHTFITWTYLSNYSVHKKFSSSIENTNLDKRIIPLPTAHTLKRNQLKKIVKIINSIL